LQSDAFCEEIANAGFECQRVRLPRHHGHSYAKWREAEQKVYAAIDEWSPPLGLFVVGDDMGRMVAQMCQHRALRVPQDVAIIAGANEETICEHARPTLTSLEFGYQRVGYEAAKLLDRLMRQRARGKQRESGAAPPHILLPPQGVVVRESTDFFSVDDSVVADALAFIAANCHRRLKQDDVARAVKAETRTLQMRFRKFLDRPIVAVIRQLRLERAKRELVQSTRSMKEIAQDVGFEDPARMNDAFRRELNITPSEYRRQRQLDREV
ncbi:MAG: substrate-binding domain-containing protein, partial [Pirellulales bacterium]